MKALNPAARAVAILLQQIAHVSTDGVRVKVLQGRFVRPTCDGTGMVELPACLFDGDMQAILRRTWRHELQHARDLLDGIDLPLEQMEARARQAELLT
jgi:hypothetical protein